MNEIRQSTGFMKPAMLVFIFVMLIISNGLMAQGKEYGFRVGLQGAMTYNQGNIVEGGLESVYGGFFFGKPVGSTFFKSWITGLDYMQCGYYGDIQNFRRIHYLGVPQALRFHFGPFHLQAGVSFNIKVAEKLLEDGIRISGGSSKSFMFDLPLMAGAGVQIMDVFLDLRLYYGWLNIQEGNKNVFLQAGLGYSF